MKLISIIVPVFNEEKNIPLFFDQVVTHTKDLPYNFEYVFVNDGSSDNSSSELGILQTQNPSVRVIDFSRNFGKEIATTAGIHHAAGDAVI